VSALSPTAAPAGSLPLRHRSSNYLLAGLAFVAIVSSLCLSYRFIQIHSEAELATQQWAARISDYADLDQFAAQLVAAVSEAFISPDLRSAEQRFEDAVRAFDQKFSAARHRLAGGDALALARQLDQIRADMDVTRAQARAVFADLWRDQATAAQGRAVATNRAFTKVNTGFSELHKLARGIEAGLFADQARRAAQLYRFGVVLAALIAAGLLTALLRARHIARALAEADAQRDQYLTGMKASRDDLEQRVQQRTAAIVRVNDALSRQIVERTQAAQALRQSEARLRQVMDLVPHLIFAKDQDGRFVIANRALALYLGSTVEQIIGKTEFDLGTEGEYARGYAEDDREVIASGKPKIIEAQRGSDAQGTQRFFHVIKIPITFTGTGARGVMGVASDVTDRMKAEAQARELNEQLEERVRLRTAELAAANRELEAFAYSVSHDLRSPLRGIDGWSQALAEDHSDKLDAEGQQYLARVRTEAQRMSQLIDGLLALSQLPRTPVQRDEIDLGALAHTVANKLIEREPGRSVKLVIQPEVFVQGDASLLALVLQNLLENAWKFTSKHAAANIEFGALQRDGEVIYFVRDDGAGFDMAHAHKLFGVFQRLHRQGDFPGTGVGLASAQRIIDRHGGRMWAEGALDQGATFYFTLGNE
jgi:PAS domain S-box-containing protein